MPAAVKAGEMVHYRVIFPIHTGFKTTKYNAKCNKANSYKFENRTVFRVGMSRLGEMRPLSRTNCGWVDKVVGTCIIQS